MELQFIQGKDAIRNSGAPLKEGEAFVFVNGKQVKQEIIDRFDISGAYVGERPTGMMGKLIVNLYKISVDIEDEFNEHVPCLKFTDIDNPDSYNRLALIPSTVHKWNGEKEEDWYISERLNDGMYCKPSEIYRRELQKANGKWASDALGEDQSN